MVDKPNAMADIDSANMHLDDIAYEKRKLNPLVVGILQVLKTANKSLGIHELLQEVKTISKVPKLDEDEQLALFKLNWLMMNALYQLQWALLDSGYYLYISTLDIHLQPLHRKQVTAETQAVQQQPLREYYLDWNNFSDTTVDEVQAILDGVWQAYLNPAQQKTAYGLLGLAPSAKWPDIKKAYRQLVAKYHPDKGGDAQRFMEIRQAYECLKQTHAG